jgi:pentatricopeptide repeat protein
MAMITVWRPSLKRFYRVATSSSSEPAGSGAMTRPSNFNNDLDKYKRLLHQNDLTKAERQLRWIEMKHHVNYGSLYGPMISALARAAKFPKCEQYLQKMISKGVNPNLACYNRIIKSYSHALEPHQAERLVRDLVSRGLTPDLDTCLPIVKAYISLSQPEAARQFLRQQMMNHRSSPSPLSPQLPSPLIKYYLEQSVPSTGLAVSMIKEMVTHNLLPNSRDVLSILKSFCQSHLPQEAEGFLRYLITAIAPLSRPELSSLHPHSLDHLLRDLRTYHLLMNAYAQASRPQDVERILMSLLSPTPPSPYHSLGIIPTAQTFTIAMNAFTALSQFHRSEAIFNLLLSTSTSTPSPSSHSVPIVPDLVCFTSLMTCFVESKRYKEAIQTFNQLIIEHKIPPDTTCYNIYLRAIHGLQQQCPDTPLEISSKTPLPLTYDHVPSQESKDKSRELISSSSISSLPPLGTDSYNTLIHHAVEMFHPQQGECLLRLMICEGLSPNVITYSTLIQGYLKVGLDQEMQRLFQELLSKNLSPTQSTFHSLLMSSCRHGDIPQALKRIKEMEEEYHIPSSVRTYNHLLDYYTVTNQLNKAERLFFFLKEHSNLKLNLRSYKYLLKIYEQNNCKVKRKALQQELSAGIASGSISVEDW